MRSVMPTRSASCLGVSRRSSMCKPPSSAISLSPTTCEANRFGLFGAKHFRQRLIKSLKMLNDRCWGVRRGKTIGKSFVAKQPRNQEWNQPTLGHLPYLGLCLGGSLEGRARTGSEPSVHLTFKFAKRSSIASTPSHGLRDRTPNACASLTPPPLPLLCD